MQILKCFYFNESWQMIKTETVKQDGNTTNNHINTRENLGNSS